jgi:hypothetical protein
MRKYLINGHIYDNATRAAQAIAPAWDWAPTFARLALMHPGDLLRIPNPQCVVVRLSGEVDAHTT